jgi:hypothetical protein
MHTEIKVVDSNALMVIMDEEMLQTLNWREPLNAGEEFRVVLIHDERQDSFSISP